MTGRDKTEIPREGMPSFPDVSASYPVYSDIMKAPAPSPTWITPSPLNLNISAKLFNIGR